MSSQILSPMSTRIPRRFGGVHECASWYRGRGCVRYMNGSCGNGAHPPDDKNICTDASCPSDRRCGKHHTPGHRATAFVLGTTTGATTMPAGLPPSLPIPSATPSSSTSTASTSPTGNIPTTNPTAAESTPTPSTTTPGTSSQAAPNNTPSDTTYQVETMVHDMLTTCSFNKNFKSAVLMTAATINSAFVSPMVVLPPVQPITIEDEGTDRDDPIATAWAHVEDDPRANARRQAEERLGPYITVIKTFQVDR